MVQVRDSSTEAEQRLELQRAARRALDSTLSNKDRVMMALQSYGVAEPAFAMDDLVGKTRLRGTQVYAALDALRREGKLEVLTEPIGNSGRVRVAGARLRKMPSPDKIMASAVENATPTITANIARDFIVDVPLIQAFADKISAISKAQEILNRAGIEHELDVLITVPDPLALAKEAVMLLEKYKADTFDLASQLGEASARLAADRRQSGITGRNGSYGASAPLNTVDDREGAAVEA